MKVQLQSTRTHDTDTTSGKYIKQTLKKINGITRALAASMEWKCQAQNIPIYIYIGTSYFTSRQQLVPSKRVGGHSLGDTTKFSPLADYVPPLSQSWRRT